MDFLVIDIVYYYLYIHVLTWIDCLQERTFMRGRILRASNVNAIMYKIEM
jgi:hypothetical protein